MMLQEQQPAWVEEALEIRAAGYLIPAVVTLPGDADEVVGRVLLVPGSLFLDVDGNYPAWDVSDPTTAVFADIPPGGAPYLTEIDAVDPAGELAGVETPVLLVQGGRDASVRPHHADALRRAREEAELETEVAFFPEVQHFYKRVASDVNPMEAFALDTDSDPAVAGAIDAWIRRLTGDEEL